MFDFHIHSTVSYDGHTHPRQMVEAARVAGLREICFTDHLDYDPLEPSRKLQFDLQTYREAYEPLNDDRLKIRRGMEFGMLPDNQDTLCRDVQRYGYDFVIGSVHFTAGLDPYFDTFWEDKTMDQAERLYLEQILTCVGNHDGFDVLGHLTYISKTWANPCHRPVDYRTYRELVDEIFRELIRKDKGIEVNTSGKDPCGVFLPAREFVQRFKELGGKIVTVGSDAHNGQRVGQYCLEACQMVAEVFGYVCTFEKRVPIFHKL